LAGQVAGDVVHPEAVGLRRGIGVLVGVQQLLRCGFIVAFGQVLLGAGDPFHRFLGVVGPARERVPKVCTAMNATEPMANAAPIGPAIDSAMPADANVVSRPCANWDAMPAAWELIEPPTSATNCELNRLPASPPTAPALPGTWANCDWAWVVSAS